MSRTDVFDLGRLRLSPGEGRRLDLETPLAPLELAGQRYEAIPAQVPVRLDVSRMTGGGYSLRLRFTAAARPVHALSARRRAADRGRRAGDRPARRWRGA